MSDGEAARWQRLQDIVQAALDRPADARAAFLDEACGGDEALRREAASLLQHDDRASAFLATPLAALAAGAVTYSPGGTPTVDDSRDLTGARLGDYEIRSRLGAGGMGEVYRARDHALHRDVAIKVLPAAFATDPERLARFEREAVLLASLNHTHIGAVYGLAGAGTMRGIVLELIEGETLESRLKLGPIPLKQTLSLAQQIARALDHAHQHGVMHRDLKPANIMLTKSGAKLLDFGLAKWGAPRSGYSPSPGSASARPEGAESVTSEGTILGTLHYMAPEQLEGKRVDTRADVFAFGAVLYEMLTGRRAFDGGSAAAVMASVLNTQPAELETIQRLASPALERIVRKCLAKDPDDRWQTVRDLADELNWISTQTAPAVVDHSNPVLSGRRISQRVMVAAVVVASLLAGGGTAWYLAHRGASSPARTLAKFELLPAPGLNIGDFNISADGSLVTYVSGLKTNVVVRRIDQFTAVTIAGTEDARTPFFSPDGNWVAYVTGSRLMKVKVDGTEPPLSIYDMSERYSLAGASWQKDGTIVFGSFGNGLRRISAEGGEPTLLTKLETPQEEDHRHPSFLPGGKAVLFTLHDSQDRFHIAVENLATSERRVIIKDAYDARFVASGHLVFGKENAIWAVPFDPERLEVTGARVNLVESVAAAPQNGAAGFRLSDSGTLVFRPMLNIDGRTLTWVNRSGAEELLRIPPQAFSSPTVSPDGSKVAFATTTAGRRDIFTYELSTERLTRLTREGDNRVPVWTRDGLRLTYASMFGETPRLLWQLADGSAPAETLATGGSALVPGVWSADNREFYYTDKAPRLDTPLDTQLVVWEKAAPTSPRRIKAKGAQRQPSLSPDGRWLAYTGLETGRTEVYVSSLPAEGTHHQVTIEGGRQPKWSRDGRELVYRSGRRVFAVTVDTTRGFSAGKPRLLFEQNYVVAQFETQGQDYDLAPDGRLLMIKPSAEEQVPSGLRVTLNWVDELVRRVPSGQ